MDIIKVLEKLTGKDYGWTDKEILSAVENIKLYNSRRETVATAVLQGICASGPDLHLSNVFLAQKAVKLADALIQELEK